MKLSTRIAFYVFVVAMVVLCSIIAVYASEKRNYEVWGRKDAEVIIMPHVAPVLYVKQVAGPPIPEKGSLDCVFAQESEVSPHGDNLKILVGHCSDGVVVNLVGIDLNH